LTIAEAQADFDQTKAWGVAGFPALVLQKDAKLHSLASGYTRADTLAANLRDILDRPS
jgi:protein-disulfide isomerase-like protein with CxxC motif